MPPNSLYWTQKSLSRISAAAAKRSNAASPLVRVPLLSSGPSLCASIELLFKSVNPTPTPIAPAATPCFRNQRRSVVLWELTTASCTCPPLGQTFWYNQVCDCPSENFSQRTVKG